MHQKEKAQQRERERARERAHEREKKSQKQRKDTRLSFRVFLSSVSRSLHLIAPYTLSLHMHTRRQLNGANLFAVCQVQAAQERKACEMLDAIGRDA